MDSEALVIDFKALVMEPMELDFIEEQVIK